MLNSIEEFYNRIVNKKIHYKCVAYVDDNKGGDKIVEAFEISEYSLKSAYTTAYDVLKFKYPNCGIDVRIFNNQNNEQNRKNEESSQK